jgi:hypothetical protein
MTGDTEIIRHLRFNRHFLDERWLLHPMCWYFICIIDFHFYLPFWWGLRWRSWLRHYATRGFESRRGELIQLIWSFQPHYCPGIDSASKRNEYQESSWGLKGGRRIRLTIITPYVRPIVWRKCGSLYVSQFYGPPRPVIGIALPSLYLSFWSELIPDMFISE